MAKIAAQLLASGSGWTVSDVVCGAGPDDRPFEEQHVGVNIAIVAAGTFQYRSRFGHDLLTPGSLLLGDHGRAYECRHEHGTGDRCISFGYSIERFEELTQRVAPRFGRSRIPVLRAFAPVVARAFAAVSRADANEWEEISVTLAAQALSIAADDTRPVCEPPSSSTAAVTRIVRAIDRDPSAPMPLGRLARAAGLSPYHVLRTFERVTGATPHQYLLRTRLRHAAVRLAGTNAKIIDVAMDAGFSDVSNFNRAFRAEFGTSPRAYRRGRSLFVRRS